MEDQLTGVTWFRRSSVRIRRGSLEVHIDPIGAPVTGYATHVLLTHPHFDNFSEDDIARLRGPDTVVIAPASMKKQFTDADHLMRPGDLLHIEGVDVLAVPAFNQEKRYHPAENAWLGYVFTLGDTTFYHAGHTDLLDTMGSLNCDVAFLPCDGHYTMGPEDAVRAAERCGARVVVPIHWGHGDEARGHAEYVAQHFDGEVRLLRPGYEVGPDGDEATAH